MQKIYNLGFTTSLIGVEDGTHYCAVNNGTDYENDGNGMYFVVYDNELKGVIDKANIDTTSENLIVTHY